jgi:hypothetical protein
MLAGDEIPRLRALIETEHEQCARLAAILEAERSAAATLDHPALLACLKERETVLAGWHRSAAARRDLLRASGESLTAVAARERSLGDVVRAFRTRAAEVRRSQRINAGLIGAALKQVTDLLTAIKRELPDARYDGRAALTAAQPVVRTRDWSA